jgi:general secretion pathway protein L
MLNEILLWWWQQMIDLLPERWRNLQGDYAGALLVEPIANDETLRIHLPSRGNQHTIEHFPLTAAGMLQILPVITRLRPRRCILMLPPEQLLERSVTLPLAAERDWERIMVFEMDRFTPFTASEIFWSAKLNRRDRSAGRIELLLSLVPRASLAPLLAMMAQGGLHPQQLQVEIAGGQRRVIAFERSASRSALRERRAVRAALGLCATLAIVAVTLPFVLQAWALHDLRQRIAALRPQVAEVEALQREIKARSADNDWVTRLRLQSIDPVTVLGIVTEALPDDTYLWEFNLDHGRLSITGQSAAAARLIGLLAASPHIRAPSFSAPVTRNEATHMDLFSIRAEVIP